MERTHLKLTKGPQSESTFNHITANGNDVQDMAEIYSQQAQRNPDIRGQDTIGKNSINQEFTERSQALQDVVNLNSNFRVRQETLEGNATNSALCQETRQGGKWTDSNSKRLPGCFSKGGND